MWKFARAVNDGQAFCFDGLNVWEYPWQSTDERALVKDPHYGREYSMQVYTITDGKVTVTFAAGEFSNCVWGFYVPG